MIWFLVPLAASAHVTVSSGGRLVVRGGVVMNLHCGTMTVTGGGVLDIADGGRVENCGNVILADRAAFNDGTGVLTMNGTWENNSDFVISDTRTITFTGACGAVNSASGASDSDGDGLGDGIENRLGTDPFDTDSDHDNMTDGMEDANHNGEVDAGESDPLKADAGPGIPVRVAPADAAMDIPMAALLATDYAAGAEPSLHGATRWQIATDAAFVQLTLDITSADQLLVLAVPEMVLQAGITYHWRACFIGSDGHARMWSAGWRFVTTAQARFTDADANGIPDDQQAGSDDEWDLDGDGQDDLTQGDMRCVTLPDGDGLFCLKPITNVDAIQILERVDPKTFTANDSRPDPMRLGLYGFRLSVPDPDTETVLRAYFSESIDPFWGWIKVDAVNGWQDYTGYVTFDEARTAVTIQLIDGGFGDADGVANGVIVDPSGPGVAAPNNGHSHGGCFISCVPLKE